MQSIRNIAIIAHVDHGKTTLVDKIIHASKIFRENQEFGDLILDNNDLERKRDHHCFQERFCSIQRRKNQHHRYTRSRRFRR